MKIYVDLFIYFILSKVEISIAKDINIHATNKTRRILGGVEAGDSKPYMVYLRPALDKDSRPPDPNWMCGGVIIHERYILTSAACIENVKHFYVVSGTHRWIPHGVKDDCVTNGAKKAVWKCVPVNYDFDGHQFDNIRWMMNDIAVVKVEDSFNFNRRILGCDFIPKKITYNNQSADLEKPGTVGSIAGWGSQDSFGDVIKSPERATINSPVLMETVVVLISSTLCKKRWPERYHHIIDKSMICAKDDVNSDKMSAVCNDQLRCKELISSEEDEFGKRRSLIPMKEEIHSASHSFDFRRSKVRSGGFCENDHGGPLVVGHGTGAVVTGVISACLTANITRKCYGPFLYTSVYRNRMLITCAIEKENVATCRKLLLPTTNTHLNETTFNWSGHPDGPAKSEKTSKPRVKKPSKKKS